MTWQSKAARVAVPLVLLANAGALQARSVESLWTAETGGWIYASPAVVGEVVVVASCAGTVFGFDRSTGATSWQHDLEAGFHAEPVVAGSTYVVPVDDGTVAAFDAASGQLLWQTEVGPSGIFSGLVRSGDRVVGALHGSFVSIAISNGEIVAGTPPALSAAAPRLEGAIGGGLFAFVNEMGEVEGVDLESGEPRWRADLGVTPSSAPVAAPVGFLIGTEDRRLVRLDYESGEERESFELPVVLEGRPVLDGATLLATARGRSMVAVNTVTGELAWERNDRRWAAPRLIRAEGGILIGATDGTLAVIEPLFGESVWEHQLSGVIRGFTCEGDTFYAGNQDGKLFALRVASSGAQAADQTID